MKLSLLHIWFIVETLDNQVRDISFEFAKVAEYISAYGNTDMHYLVPCSAKSSSIEEFIRTSSCPVDLLLHPDLRYHQPMLVADFIRKTIDSEGPSLFFMCDTIRGASTAAYAAALAQVAFVPRVSGFSLDDGDVIFHSRDEMSRTTHMISPLAGSAVVTLFAGSFMSMDESAIGQPVVETISHHEDTDYPYHPLDLARSSTGADLANARVIIAAGRGIRSRENLELFTDLAEAIPQSALAASRPVCDAGWMPLSSQVGMTGQTVRPDLYIACGISGSAQHLVGMKDSGCIVAINTDPEASIFSVADYCIVEDLTQFLPAFLKAYRSLAAADDDNNE